MAVVVIRKGTVMDMKGNFLFDVGPTLEKRWGVISKGAVLDDKGRIKIGRNY